MQNVLLIEMNWFLYYKTCKYIFFVVNSTSFFLLVWMHFPVREKIRRIKGTRLVCLLLTYSNVKGLPKSLKYGIRCERVCTAKSLNSSEYLASEVFGFPTSLNSPKIFFLIVLQPTRYLLKSQTGKLRLMMKSLCKDPMLFIR